MLKACTCIYANPYLTGETAAAADGKHPTGIHSCLQEFVRQDTPGMLMAHA